MQSATQSTSLAKRANDVMSEQAGCRSAVDGEDPVGGLTDRKVRHTENRDVTKLPVCDSHTRKTRNTIGPNDSVGRVAYLLTPWCRVLLEKITGSQLVKKFPAFYGNRVFITAFTNARHLSLS